MQDVTIQILLLCTAVIILGISGMSLEAKVEKLAERVKKLEQERGEG